MTDDERFALLHGLMILPHPNSAWPMPDRIPSAGFVAGAPRLGVPSLRMTDASLGVANPLQLRPGDFATALPSGLSIASSFDPDSARRLGRLVGEEARVRGFNVLLGGGINLARDPRNGRNFEYLGEDPLLAGVLGGEYIRGVQDAGVISTVKHFSLNAQETLRRSVDARIDEQAHRESDLLAFLIAIERGRPGAVMCAYNWVNGTPSCGNEHLLTRTLKQDWGYSGWVMSDWGTTASLDYFDAGLDQQMGAQMDAEVWFDAPLRARVEASTVARSRLSDAVRRILGSIYSVGLDQSRPASEIDYDIHARSVRDAATAGIVLLKNDGLLPLIDGPRSILVVGGYADVGVMSGGGSSQVTPRAGVAALIPVGGAGFLASFGKQLIMPSSPLAALRAALPEARIAFDGGYFPEASAAAARHADVVIVFATQWQGEGLDASSLSLPQGQDALIAGIAAANPNTIVVLETGNPVLMPWLGDVRAVVQAWYPGQEGGDAIADILVGAVNPSGRLPMTFPASVDQLPRPQIDGLGLPDRTPVLVRYEEGARVGYRGFSEAGHTPLFPFGHGLSYTTFVHRDLVVRERHDGVHVALTVENTGPRAGVDIPQVYLVTAAGEPLFRLAGFVRTPILQAGESTTVELEIDLRLLANWNDGEWWIRPGAYSLAVGASATDLGPRAVVSLPERRWNSALAGMRGDSSDLSRP